MSDQPGSSEKKPEEKTVIRHSEISPNQVKGSFKLYFYYSYLFTNNYSPAQARLWAVKLDVDRSKRPKCLWNLAEKACNGR